MITDKATTNLVDLKAYRLKKEVEEGLTRGRKPLYVSMQNKSMQGASKGLSDFSERIANIRKSFEDLAETLGKSRKSKSKPKIVT